MSVTCLRGGNVPHLEGEAGEKVRASLMAYAVWWWIAVGDQGQVAVMIAWRVVTADRSGWRVGGSFGGDRWDYPLAHVCWRGGERGWGETWWCWWSGVGEEQVGAGEGRCRFELRMSGYVRCR